MSRCRSGAHPSRSRSCPFSHATLVSCPTSTSTSFSSGRRTRTRILRLSTRELPPSSWPFRVSPLRFLSFKPLPHPLRLTTAWPIPAWMDCSRRTFGQFYSQARPLLTNSVSCARMLGVSFSRSVWLKHPSFVFPSLVLCGSISPSFGLSPHHCHDLSSHPFSVVHFVFPCATVPTCACC